jgi:hypothetical protein
MGFFPAKTNIAEERKHRIRMLGTGNGTVPTLDLGHGVTLLWVATGRIKITWAENPGTFVGLDGWGFRDATQGNVKGWTATAGVYPLTASTFTIEIDFWNSSFAAADLAATSYLDLILVFSELKNP